MTQSASGFSVASLFAEREARRQREREQAEQLHRRKLEELDSFKKRLDDFQITDDTVQVVLARIHRAFDNGDTELMLTSFPSSFCTDAGRAVGNAGLEPINKPAGAEPADAEPAWLATLPAGARPLYAWWEAHLKPGGFGFAARIINYPDGKPGDVGLFFTWPKSLLDA